MRVQKSSNKHVILNRLVIASDSEAISTKIRLPRRPSTSSGLLAMTGWSRMTLLTFFILTIFYLLLTTASPALADFLYSPNYQIEAPNVNIGSDNYTSPTTGTKISSTLGQTAAEQFSSAGYLVRAGFQYIFSIAPFTFTISSTNIPFGSLTPGTPVTATTNFTVGFSSANGYQVTAREDDSLKTLTGTPIVDTSCDSGTPCTISSANTWSSNSTYGFGYNMNSGSYPNDIPADFTSSSKYRPFANLALAENPVVVMFASNTTTPAHLYADSTRQSTMTFKVNIGATQTAGTYTTVVRFTATSLY